MNASARLWTYVKNAILFQLVAVPVCVTIYLLMETIRGAFPNPSMSLGAWLATALKIFFTYGVTGGLLLSLLHTWFLSRFRSPSTAATLRRSLVYAGAIAFGQAIPLFLLLWGTWAPFVILIPGALAYGWVVGRRWARETG